MHYYPLKIPRITDVAYTRYSIVDTEYMTGI
jgi:hypothetical protein